MMDVMKTDPGPPEDARLEALSRELLAWKYGLTYEGESLVALARGAQGETVNPRGADCVAFASRLLAGAR